MRVYTCLVVAIGLIIGPVLRARAHEASSTATGIANRFNPAISLNSLILVRAGAGEAEDAPVEDSEHASPTRGLMVQESELQLTAFADPYLKADFIYSQHGIEGIELEEGTVSAQTMPAGFGLRLGRIKTEFGKHNPLHSHAFPFVEPPMILDSVFGEEGLSEIAVELSLLLPAPWYSEVLAGVASGDNEVLFHSERARDLGYAGRWRNVFDLRPTTTLDIGLSGVAGRNEEAGATSRVVGADLTLKHKPLSAVHGKAVLQGEYVRANVADVVATGGYGAAQYQITRRWWVQGGFDWATPFGADGSSQRIRAAVALVPTEFSVLKAQYSGNRHYGEDTEHELLLQLNTTIGAHPAHAY